MSVTFDDILAFETNENVFKNHFLHHFEADHIVPFIGAGLSVESGYPLWWPFLEAEAKRLSQESEELIMEHLASNEYEDAAQVLADNLGDRGLSQRIQETFGGRRPPQGAVTWLPRAFPSSQLMLTTNYDDLIERVYREHSVQFQVEYGASIAAVKFGELSGVPHLFKLHGRASDAKGRVLTSQDYDREYGSPLDMTKMLPQTLSAIFGLKSVLFLGCSMASDRTMEVLANLCLPGLFALLSLPTKRKDAVALRRRLSELGVQAMYYPAGQHSWVELFLRGLADRVPVGKR